GTNSGLFSFDGNNWLPYLGLSGNKIIDLLSVGNSLYILDTLGTDKVYLYDGTAISEYWSTNTQVTKLGYQQNAGLIVATKSGINVNNNYVFPNGPAANQFPNMTVDKEGNLWSASGKDITGVGIYKYNGNYWLTYDAAHNPELSGNSYYSIFSAADNSIYSGSWGIGFVKIKQNEIIRYHAANSEMVYTKNSANNSNFIVITGFAEDSKNNLWIINLNAADLKSLYLLTPDSIWYSFRNPLEQHVGFSEVHNLVVDQYGTKWYSMSGEGSNGLFYYNEKGTYTDVSDDVYGFITTPKLSSDAINSLAIDRRGDLWVGTSLGVNIITNLNSVLASQNPQLNISSSFSVRQQSVNTLAVDPLNQKWLGTNQGLFLLSSDGTQLLATLNTNNSALLSDQIESIAIDESTGKVYVGTANGLTSFDTPSILPVESFAGLNIYPNPLVIKDGSNLVTIDGLIRNTDIKIVTVSGKLVREFSSPGGRTAFWDGRDDSGNFVSSGVYIVIAFDQEGNSVETGKIAVLRD
ncbi:MAG: two-component regulator propeller domain-containing protein, partial [Ignavibacteriota bacterium]